MINNLSAYSFANNDVLTLYALASGALTTGELDPQTGQTRDGGYSPPPISVVYTPREIDGEDSLIFDNYLCEGSSVSINLSTTSTCVNVATGYDLFNFGYQLLIEEKGQVLDKIDTFNYNNTFNIVCSASLISNWKILSSTATYNKIVTSLSGTGSDLLPVGLYRRATSPNDILTVKYYLPIEESAPIFWTGELLNVYKTKKIVWDMFSTRLGGEDLKGDYIPFKRNETSYIVDLPRDITQYDPKVLLYNDQDFSLSATQLGNSISSGLPAEMLGYSIDINDAGNRIVVGGIGGLGNDEGVVRAYELVNSSWVQMGQTLYGDDACDFFGVSVSMNYDGSRIAVGYHNQCGAVFDRRGGTKIYEWNGSQWIQLGSTIRGLFTDDDSGESIQLNSVGDRIVIAEPYGANGDGVSTIRVFNYNGSAWTQMGQTINGEMYSGTISKVAINSIGDIIAGASTGEDSITNTNGVVRIYKWDGIQWNKIADINDSILGATLAMNSAGDIIASSNSSTDVNIYKNNDGVWSKLGNTIPYPGVNTGSFGYSIDINYIGDRIAIGDPQAGLDDSGNVFVYEFDGIDWRSIVEPIVEPISTNNNITINVLGTGALPPTTLPGTMERFRLNDGTSDIWSFGPTISGYNESFYPNWVGNPGVNTPYSIPPVIVSIPTSTNTISFYVLENANGFPVDPGPIYSPFTTRTAGTSWYYDITFPNGQRFTGNNLTGFKFSPPSENPYWAPEGTQGNEGLEFVWNRIIKFFGYSVALNKLGDKVAIGQPNDAGSNKISRAHVYNLPEYPLLTLSAFEAYKSVVLWSDGVVRENLFTSPFYLPDGTYGSSAGVINFRKFTTTGEYTILSNTFYYKNSLGFERILTEPYNITFVVS